MVSDNTVLLLFSHFSKFSDMASEREAKQLEAATEALGGRVADVKSSLGQLIRFFYLDFLIFYFGSSGKWRLTPR